MLRDMEIWGKKGQILRFPLGFRQVEARSMSKPNSLLAAMALIGLVVVEIATRLLFWA
jgi:hypothetical protein